MKYISTRGGAPTLGFVDVLLAGLAADGGLYVPDTWPTFSAAELRAMRGKPYADVAFTVLKPFVGGEIAGADLKAMIDEAYGTFAHKAVVPLKQLDANQWLMELFHGPTLAFKDVAMQLLARLMDHALARSGRRATIVGATSGDTGGAAIEAFSNSTRTDVFILHPHGRVSDVQRRQMTTVGKANVHNIALEGTFDDAQAHVKAMFADVAFRDRVLLSGVNSINWARIMAQTVYYFTSALALGGPDRPVSFCVPSKANEYVLEVYGSNGAVKCKYTLAQLPGGEVRACLIEDLGGFAAQEQARYQGGYQPLELEAKNTYQSEIEAFSQAILDGRPAPVPGEDGLWNHIVIEAAYESARIGER